MITQPLFLWAHWGAPNPWKVRMALEAQHLPYDLRFLELSQVKNEEHVKLNPNGRSPTLEDSNTGLVLWELASLAPSSSTSSIKYDKDGFISCLDSPRKFHCQQWPAFQISGQGPYFGQATRFARFHPEKIQSAIDRYIDEILRVTGVLDTGLARNGTGWLVGDSCTYAALSFVTWALIGEGLLRELGKLARLDEYMQYKSWRKRLCERPEVSKIREQMAQGRRQHGLA